MKQGWEYKKLGEVCEVTMGQSPNGSSINESEGIEFHQGKTCFGDRFLGKSNQYTTSPTKFAEVNSVLLCVRAPVGFPNITNRKICIGRGLCSLISMPELDNNFLFYALLGKQDYFEKNATGSTFKAISSKVVSNALIPLPPLAVQESIVRELDEINNLIQLKKEQIKDLDSLAQSLFYEMFGDPVTNEKGWEIKKLGEVTETTSGGTPSSKKSEYYKDGNIPWLRSGEVSQGFITETGMFITEEGLKNSSARYVPINSVAIAMYGATVGQVGIIKKKMTTNQAICSIFPCKQMSPMYLMYFMRQMKPHYLKLAVGGAQPNISQTIIKSSKIPLPPLALQQSFAERIEAIEKMKTEIKSAIADLEVLLASRMQHWFD